MKRGKTKRGRGAARNGETLEKARALAVFIEDFVREIQDVDDKLVLTEVQKVLGAPSGQLALIAIPMIEKIHEVVYTSGKPNLQVCDGRRGADLRDTSNGASIEHKSSRYNPNTGACNFNFNLPFIAHETPGGDSEQARRKKILQSIAKKTKNGGIIFVAVDDKQVVMKEYHLSHTFAMEYFGRIKFKPSSRNHNIHSYLCQDCGEFHRIKKLEDFSRLRETRALTESEWGLVLRRTARNCGTKSSAAPEEEVVSEERGAADSCTKAGSSSPAAE